MSEINVDSNNKNFSSDKGVLYSKDKTLLIKCPMKTSLRSYEAADSVQTISDYAFYNCTSLKSLSLGKNTSAIGKYALAAVSSAAPICLDQITLPDKLEAVGENALNCLQISQINVSESCESVPSLFYSNEYLTDIIVDSNNKFFSSDKGVLYNGDKTELIRCPQNTSLISYKVSDSTTAIGDEAFYCCYSVTDIDLGKNTSVIGKQAFNGSSYKKMIISQLTVPDSIEAMADDSFSYTEIHKLSVGQSVRYIPDRFINDLTLSEIDVADENAVYSSDNGILYSADKSVLIRCPVKTSMITYKVNDNTVSIAENAFNNCTTFKKIDLGKNVTSIGKNAFYCTDIWAINTMEVTLSDNIEQLGENAFSNFCITKLTVPESVITIPERIYTDTALTEINVSQSNRYFSSDKGILFNKDKTELIKCPHTSSLLTYDIPESTNTIYDNAFANTSVKSIYIPASVTSIGTDAFRSSKIDTIKGITGSYAQSFADSKSLKFVPVDKPEDPPAATEPTVTTMPDNPVTEDPSGSQTSDVTEKPSGESGYDINGDGSINIMDVLKLKQYILSGRK